MKYNPHEYQKYAADFILEHPAAAILLDMGMGKTSIVLTAVNTLMYERFEVSKVLIVAPLRVARNTWPDEITKWDHLQGMTYAVATGSVSQRMKALQSEADLYIINRENLSWLIDKSGLPFDYDMVVLDELSSFKNSQSKRFKSFIKVRPAVRRVVGLTGTPSSNGLMDLFAEYKCLDMGKRLGRYISQYRVNYFVPDRMNGPIVYSYKLRPGAEDQIYREIDDITISMRAADYLRMPELISCVCPVRLSAREMEAYKELRMKYVLQLTDNEITAANAAAMSGKLCQLANGAVYTDDGCISVLHSRKLDALEDIMEGANGRPVLIAYWYRHDLERISERLTALGIVHGRLDTDKSISAWNAGALQAGLIHPASAGHGLNLQEGGSTLVWFGLTWSLELYQQTVGRIWRQGQTSETVKVIHIMAADTIDVRIMELLDAKDRRQSALIEAVKAEIGITEEKQ